MLELPNNFIDKEDSSFGGEHAHGDIIESQGSCTIFTNFDILSFSKYGLKLHSFRKRRTRVFTFHVLIFKNILGLVSDLEVNHLGAGEFIGYFDGELDLFVEKARNIPDPITNSACNL